MFFGKIDKIFRIKGDFVNQGGKLMFALNPKKLKKDQQTIQKPKKQINIYKRLKEQKRILKVLEEARQLKVVEAQINQLIQKKMKASYERDLGMMLRAKTIIKSILEFLFGYPIFIFRRIPDLINFFGLPMEIVARERWAFFQRRKIKKINKRAAIVKKSEIFVKSFNQVLRDQNFQLERANMKAANILEITNENLINLVTELENQFELAQLIIKKCFLQYLIYYSKIFLN